MKTHKTTAIILAVSTGVLLIGLVIIVWQYMKLRKAVAIVATKTANPSSSAISAAVTSTEQAALLIV